MTGETTSPHALDSFSWSPRRALVAALVMGFLALIGVSLAITMGRAGPDADDLAVSVGGPLMFTLAEIGDSAWSERALILPTMLAVPTAFVVAGRSLVRGTTPAQPGLRLERFDLRVPISVLGAVGFIGAVYVIMLVFASVYSAFTAEFGARRPTPNAPPMSGLVVVLPLYILATALCLNAGRFIDAEKRWRSRTEGALNAVLARRAALGVGEPVVTRRTLMRATGTGLLSLVPLAFMGAVASAPPWFSSGGWLGRLLVVIMVVVPGVAEAAVFLSWRVDILTSAGHVAANIRGWTMCIIVSILIVACGIGLASMGPRFAFTVVLAFAGFVPIPFAAFAKPNPYNWPWPPFLDVAARQWAAWSLDGNAAQVRKLLNRVGSGSG